MSRNVIEVPIKRNDHAVAHMFWTDPNTGKEGLLGKDYTCKEDPSKNFVEIYDANGNQVFNWQAESGKPLDHNRFKAAQFIARQSFQAKGVQ